MIRLAVYQGGYATGVDDNIVLMAEQLKLAKEKGADLVLFPECFLGGYVSGDDFSKYSECVDGDIIGSVSQMATLHQARPVFTSSCPANLSSDHAGSCCVRIH
jgi:predicted amidohydrolase